MQKTTNFLIDRRQLAAWAGMIGSILFVAIFTLEGWLRSGYNPLGMFVSELSLGPGGWIQIVNFIVFGVLLLVFTWGVVDEFRDEKMSRAGLIILAIIGISFFVSGPFVMDPATTIPNLISWHGRLHSLFGALVFSLSPISCFIFFSRFRNNLKWRSLQWWTLTAGVIIAASVVLMKVGQAKLTGVPDVFGEWIGVIQRIAIITYLSWIFTFALELLRQSKRD